MMSIEQPRLNLKWFLNRFRDVLVCSALLLPSAIAQAQIVPDETLGRERSRINSNVLIGGKVQGDLIVGGAQRQGNLFHSFKDFNVNNGQKIYFAHPLEVNNIIARITGNTPSNIMGRLGVVGNANLFLLNPNGILFGQNAQLDIGGSFIGTTANALGFGTQGEFSATNPEAVPLLTVNPAALLYTQLSSGKIENRGLLQIPNGQSLLLVGGDIYLNKGVVTTIGGRIELGGLAEKGTVNLVNTPQGLSLQFPPSAVHSDVFLSSSLVDLTRGGGNLAITARNIQLQSGSLISAGVANQLGSFTREGGDITLNASDTIQIDSDSSIRTDVSPNEIGDSGTIKITTGSLLVFGDSALITRNSGAGNAGDVIIDAKNRVVISGDDTTIDVGVRRTGRGKGGNIRITTNILELSEGAQLISATFGKGDAGEISINARDRVSLIGGNTTNFSNTGIFSSTGGRVNNQVIQGEGKGGDIKITSNVLEILNNAQISSGTYGLGNAGNIIFDIGDYVRLIGDNTLIASRVETTGRGKGGTIRLSASNLEIFNGAAINASTLGYGDSGNIILVIHGRASLDNGNVFSAARGVDGNGGNIELSAQNLEMSNGSRLASTTFSNSNAGSIILSLDTLRILSNAELNAASYGDGNAGDIKVTARNSILLDNGLVLSRTQVDSKGKGGNIDLNAVDLKLLDSDINAISNSKGRAGDIILTASRQIDFSNSGLFALAFSTGDAGDIQVSTPKFKLDNRSIVSTESASVNGGNIRLTVPDFLLLRRKSSLSATAGLNQQGGNGGNIIINANAIVTVPEEGSTIRADAFQGQGGTITINTNGLFGLEPGINITASSQLGVQGTVSVAEPEVQPTQGTVELPTNPIPGNQISQICPRGSNARSLGSFTNSGRGSTPPNPIAPLTGETKFPLAALDNSPNRSTANATSPTSPPIVEAQGWVKTADGRVELVAQGSEVTPAIAAACPTHATQEF